MVSIFRSGFGSAMLAVVILSATGRGDEGDGKPDGKKSLGGSGHLIQPTFLAGNRLLSGIRIHGARYGTPEPPAEKFLIYVLSADRSKVVAVEMAPYSLFERGEEKWVTIPFDKQINVPEGGWIGVDFRPGRTKGVYVSYDSHAGAASSKVGLPGQEARDVEFAGDWMISPISPQ